MKQPNLFSYATSELSQDAFICWLLSWASPQYKDIDKELYNCSIRFINSLFTKSSRVAPKKIEKIKISKQDKNIDVLCILNEKYAVLIEDKTGTKSHSDQLTRYLKDVKDRDYDANNILPIYFKTKDQGDKYRHVKEDGYQPYLRKDFLGVLQTYAGGNSILIDYRNYLQSISEQVESYISLPIKEWNRNSWIGFYIRLQKEIPSAKWDYVPNPSKGFMGFWWHFDGDDACEQYLQLEQDKLCFKIWVNNLSERRILRNKWHKKIKNTGLESEYNLNIIKPPRFGSGSFMTVCIHEDDYRISSEDNLIKINETVQRLKDAEKILTLATKNA